MRIGRETIPVEPELAPLRFDRLRFVGFGDLGHRSRRELREFARKAFEVNVLDALTAQDNSFPDKRILPEVYQQTKLELRSRKIVEHLLAMRIDQLLDCLCFEQDFVEDNKVSNVAMRQNGSFIADRERPSPDAGN